MAELYHQPTDADLRDHYETYKSFVRWTLIFAAHVLAILALLAYFTV